MKLSLLAFLIIVELPLCFAQAPRPTNGALIPQQTTPPAKVVPTSLPQSLKKAPLPELQELFLDIKGTAYIGEEWNTKFPSLSPKDLDAELSKLKLKLKLTPIDISILHRSQPPFSLVDATALIIEPFEKQVMGKEYSLVMALDPGGRCYREVQIVTLKSSGFKSIKQLDGKDLAFLDGRESVVYLTKTPIKYNRLFMGGSEEELKAALTSKKVQAFIAPVYQLPQTLISQALGTQQNGSTSGDFEVIHVTNNQVPCWAIALKRGADFKAIYRLLEYGEKNKEQAKLLLGSIGNFQSMYPIPYENWQRLKEKIGNSGLYRDFKAGKLKLPFTKL